MPDALAAVLALDGLAWLALAGFLGGIVRGFSGFGNALVFLPVAGQFLSPVWAIITLMLMDAIGPLPNAPRAARYAHGGDLARMVLGVGVMLPVGLWLLLSMPPEWFRYAVSAVALAFVALMASGVRYRRPLGKPMIYATGGLAGFLGGVAGVPGPPVILLYMASPHPVRVIRANTLLFLLLFDLLALALFAALGRLELVPVLLGLVLAAPYLLGNLAGAVLFDPGKGGVYRLVAYAIITLSALAGLPIWESA